MRVGQQRNKKFYFAFSSNFFFWTYVIKSPECENNNRISARTSIAKSRATKFGESSPVYWEMRVGQQRNKKFYFSFSSNFFFWVYVIKSPDFENNKRISAGIPIAKSDPTKFGEGPPVYWEMRVGQQRNKKFYFSFSS